MSSKLGHPEDVAEMPDLGLLHAHSASVTRDS